MHHIEGPSSYTILDRCSEFSRVEHPFPSPPLSSQFFRSTSGMSLMSYAH